MKLICKNKPLFYIETKKLCFICIRLKNPIKNKEYTFIKSQLKSQQHFLES